MNPEDWRRLFVMVHINGTSVSVDGPQLSPPPTGRQRRSTPRAIFGRCR